MTKKRFGFSKASTFQAQEISSLFLAASVLEAML
jgi:hypothetical protein